MNCAEQSLSVVIANEYSIKVFNYDNEGREIPKPWYTFMDIGNGVVVEVRFKEMATYGVAVAIGKQHCKVSGLGYIGTCDIFGRKAMRDFASERLLSG